MQPHYDNKKNMIDNDLTTYIATQRVDTPWVALEFASPMLIGKVEVINVDVTSYNIMAGLRNMEIRVTDELPECTECTEMFTGGTLLGPIFVGPGGKSEKITRTAEPPVMGRFVLVQKLKYSSAPHPRDNALRIAEIAVYGQTGKTQ